MTNLARASALLGAISSAGCREVVVCGGSRNAPLLAALAAREDFRVWNFFEERSAAFFAVGRIRATGDPVAVVTTSGTAAAELLPAAIEAHYSGDPLVLVTADRPPRHRGTGAPQAIEQAGLFGAYVEASVDLAPGGEIGRICWSGTRPIHLNIGFDEPLLDGDPAPAEGPPMDIERVALPDPEGAALEISSFLERASRPLILVGGLPEREREACRNFAILVGAPLYAEPLSGLREDPLLESLTLRSGEAILRRGGFDAVLRVGSVPAVRYWRDLDETLTSTPALSASSLPFSGLGRGAHLRCDLAATLPLVRVAPRPDREIHRLDRVLAGRLRELFAKEKRSEPAIVRALSEWIPEGSLVYLGNSLPIREWDLFATRRRTFAYAANRGANGIDGQISTFLGMASETRENWCVVGDLTALYDLSSPWVLAQMPESAPIRIVVVNNGGGRIFSRVPSLRAVPAAERERLFENPHAIGFDQWAAMWDLDHFNRIRPRRPLSSRSVIELRPEAEATSRFLERYDALMKGEP
jgi:2-succinyl-5-enolpyruvyl-6-hydroxy-3-cyclohexene-1-carboxylate synthase